jgi:hypothetical protein
VTDEELTTCITDLGDLSIEVRENAANRLKELGKPTLSPLIDLLDSPSPLLRHEAARLIATITNALANRPISVSRQEPPPPIPTELKALVMGLESPDKLWRKRVEEELYSRRDEAFDLLAETLRTGFTTRPDRIVRFLGEWGDLRAVSLLLNLWQNPGPKLPRLVLFDALVRLADALVRQPLALSDADLLRFVAFARKEIGLVDSGPLGDALCRRATLRPTQALRLLLPHLKGSWLHPVPESFESARQAILAATQDLAELPLPASEPIDITNLPYPAQVSEDAHNLPCPTEERP